MTTDLESLKKHCCGRDANMTNAQKTMRFFTATDKKTWTDVLKNVASRYGISPSEALVKILGAEAKPLLDYVTGPTRETVSALVKKHRL